LACRYLAAQCLVCLLHVFLFLIREASRREGESTAGRGRIAAMEAGQQESRDSRRADARRNRGEGENDGTRHSERTRRKKRKVGASESENVVNKSNAGERSCVGREA
jgi:hypothetical protein